MSTAALALVIAIAIPAFMLRATGVMDDSVFWVVARSVVAGKVLYRDIFFTQPPLFVALPWAMWQLTSDIYLHRAFLFALWLGNGALFYHCLWLQDRITRLAATTLFLVSAFILQSYALHTEVVILTLVLIATLLVVRDHPLALTVVGLSASASFFVKPLGPLAFIPLLYATLTRRRLTPMLLGAITPVAVVTAYLLEKGNGREFAQQVFLDNGNVGLSLRPDWVGYSSLTIVSLLIPLFLALVVVDQRPREVAWWLPIVVFLTLLAMEVLRGARHYGLLNLGVLAWMTVQAKNRLELRRSTHLAGMALLLGCALAFQVATTREILNRGTIVDELAASSFVQSLPHGSLQVFATDSPRLYMLLNALTPAYPYLFVYDTNKDLLIWDSYLGMMQQSPPDYIVVDDHFHAAEYGQRRSVLLSDAAAVRTWIEQQGTYQPMDEGRALEVTMYRRS